MSKKILIQTKTFFPKVTPESKRIYSIVESLLKRGWEVHIYTSINKNNCKEAETLLPGIRVFPIANQCVHNKGIIGRLFYNFRLYMNTLLIFKKNGFKDYDVVLATSPEILPCLAIRKIAKKNKYFFVFDVRDIWPDVAFEMRSFTEKSPQSIIFNHVANALYKSASLITTVSSEKISKLKDKRACINKDIVLIENGFDERMLELESDEDTIKKMNLKDKNIVCFIGNVGFAQGLKKYIDLAKEYSLNESLRFLVVGKGSDKANVISYAHRVGADNVEFFDPISQRGIATLLRHAKISYVSLVSDSMIDSIPTKLYESLGFGCPTLLVACGSSRSLIDATQHGLYARPSSFSEIKETFGRLLKLLPSLESKKSYIAEYILNNYSRNRNSERFADILIQKLNV